MPDSAPGGLRLVRFGAFEADLRSGELRKAGVSISLQDKPFHLLARLLECPGELVTREQLQRELWPAHTFVDFERGLNTAVKRLRDALGDDPDRPHFIETLPRRGYRFIAPVVAASPSGADDAPASRRRPPARRILSWAFGALVVLAIGLWLVVGRVPRSVKGTGVTRVQIPVAPATRLGPAQAFVPGGDRSAIAVSADGRTVVFVGASDGTTRLFARPISSETAKPIEGTAGAQLPFLSPDGKWVGFWSPGALRRVPIDGGPVSTICAAEVRNPPYGATWLGNDYVVFARVIGALMKVSAGGGVPKPLTTLRRGELGHRLPHALADGKTFLFTVRTRDYVWGEEQIAVQAAGDSGHTILASGSDARVAGQGYLVFLRLGTLMAAPFDSITRRMLAVPVPVVDDIAQAVGHGNTFRDSGGGQFAVSATGVLVYARGGVARPRRDTLAWIDRTGEVELLPVADMFFGAPRLSPDGTRVAAAVFETTRLNIRVYDLARKTELRLSSDDEEQWPMWSPDGRAIVYQSVSGGQTSLRRRAADGTGLAEVLVTGDYPTPSSWLADRETLGFLQAGPPGPDGMIGWSIWRWRRDQPLRKLETPVPCEDAAFSPTGSVVAYENRDSSPREVYLQPFGRAGDRVQVSSDGGQDPAWDPLGRELYYLAPGQTPGTVRMMVAAVTTSPSLTVGVPRMLFSTSAIAAAHPIRAYDVAPDGRRFLIQRRDKPSDRATTHIEVVLNWIEEVSARVPVPKNRD
ncbi:MAG: winged helix-turn-helix domain-containing protein [Acidobacteria bacterium]|nr:winged helix-turn-helix domain-containing protein [Acidobacteriota bacterium]